MRDLETWMIFVAVVFSLLLVFRGIPSMLYIWYSWNIPTGVGEENAGEIVGSIYSGSGPRLEDTFRCQVFFTT